MVLSQLIKMVFQDIGVLAKNEPLDAGEASDALTKLNMMIDAWSVRSLMVLGALMEEFLLVAGQQFYTIGIGGDFNTTKPSRITDAFLRNSEGEDTGIEILTMEQWDSIDTKSLDTGPPIAIYYDLGPTQQTSPMGVIRCYPIPDDVDTYSLYIGEQKPLSEFISLTDIVTFQSAYYELLEYGLAKRLWRQYRDDGKPFPADLEQLRQEAEDTIMQMNIKPPTATIEIPGRRGTLGNILNFGYNWER